MKRFYLAICLFLPFFVSNGEAQERKSIEGILSLVGKEFYRETQNYAYSCLWQACSEDVSQFWRLFDQLEKQSDKDQTIESLLATEYLVNAILKYGSEVDYDKLLSIYQTIPADSNRHSAFMDALSEYWIKQELIKILDEPNPQGVIVPSSDEPLPQHLANAPQELQNAWRLYQGVMSAFEKELENYKDKYWIHTQLNWSVFYGVIADFLEGREKNAVGKMLPFEWGGWCGTGSDQLLVPKYRTIWMAFLKDRNYLISIGAFMTFMNEARYSYQWKRDEAGEDFYLRQKFIEKSGMDWEKIFIGAVLDKQSHHLTTLGTYGSTQAAEYLSQLLTLDFMDESAKSDYMRANAAFITPGCIVGNYGTFSSADITRKSQEVIPESVQKNLLVALTSQVHQEASSETMDALSHLLTKLCRQETKDALWQILNSPYPEARKRAVMTLQAMGEKAELPKDEGPVNIRLLVNGSPLANTDVWWTLPRDTQSTVSSTARTNQNGQLSLKRDYFVNPKMKPKLTIEINKMKSHQDIFFHHTMDEFVNLDQPVEINLKTTSLILDLHLPRKQEYYKDKTISIFLYYDKPSSYITAEGESKSISYYRVIGEDLHMPVSSQLAFPHLSAGKYQLTVFVPGSAVWAQTDIELNEEAKTLTVDLEPGADLKFEVVAPGEDKRDPYVSYDLLTEDGHKPQTDNHWPVHYDYRTKSYRGLPQGKYVLTILSSEEKEKKQRNLRRDDREEILPQYPPYEGETHQIIIDDQSPDVINLGTIFLKPG